MPDRRIVNPFITSAVDIIEETTGVEVTRTKLEISKGAASSGGLCIILNVTGDVKGEVIFELSRGITIRLAQKMIERAYIDFGEPESFRRLLESAIVELVNMIGGRAISMLYKSGFDSDIAPPRLIVGSGHNLVSKKQKTIVLRLRCIFGDFKIYIALAKVKEKQHSFFY